jgi:hypothetical protein
MPANLPGGVYRDERTDQDVRSLQLSQDFRIVIHASIGNRVAKPPCAAVLVVILHTQIVWYAYPRQGISYPADPARHSQSHHRELGRTLRPAVQARATISQFLCRNSSLTLPVNVCYITHLCRSVSRSSSGVTSRRETRAFIDWQKFHRIIDLSLDGRTYTFEYPPVMPHLKIASRNLRARTSFSRFASISGTLN